jgi:hypothetical protein
MAKVYACPQCAKRSSICAAATRNRPHFDTKVGRTSIRQVCLICGELSGTLWMAKTLVPGLTFRRDVNQIVVLPGIRPSNLL